MNEKRNYKQEVKDWWNDNKRVIKAGGLCLLIGAFYGFVKGINAGESSRMKLIDMIPSRNDEQDTFVYDETTVDDPELLELIRLENEGT